MPPRRSGRAIATPPVGRDSRFMRNRYSQRAYIVFRRRASDGKAARSRSPFNDVRRASYVPELMVRCRPATYRPEHSRVMT
jgi:hypothetical protein